MYVGIKKPEECYVAFFYLIKVHTRNMMLAKGEDASTMEKSFSPSYLIWCVLPVTGRHRTRETFLPSAPLAPRSPASIRSKTVTASLVAPCG